MRAFSLVVISGGYSSLWCAGFSLRWRLLLGCTGSGVWTLGRTGSVIVAQGLSGSVACGIFPDQGQTCVPCTDNWIVIHGTTREIQGQCEKYLPHTLYFSRFYRDSQQPHFTHTSCYSNLRLKRHPLSFFFFNLFFFLLVGG